ncbi:H-type small acid-soluble spore protein [Microaerobacter geothermalis]|uniref:H-type small acid-soluble spore protein n=1 Tax=Microaerobacter geothermalis TaxID=674972 RepID=UPI001F34429E|nr:H-type small acid-soluble spore protein [Microaerobacter geothermalis]MCF6093743.1 H-type small acid-soluble spore protein [Microaerobacter geothermalis]
MNVSRAKEILESNEKFNVKFEGVPVWIDSIDELSKTARVHTEDNPEDQKTVAIDELKEVGKMY